MDPLLFLETSRFLADAPKGPPAEASYRTAFGRAYYAVFGYARNLLAQRGFTFSGGSDEHQQLIAYLKKSGLLQVQAAGLQLDDLREKRNSADYDVGSARVRRGPFDNWQAVLAVAQAQKILEAVDTAAKSDRRLKIP